MCPLQPPELTDSIIPLATINAPRLIVPAAASAAAEYEEEIVALAASIESNGLLLPIIVMATDEGRFDVVDGKRRYAACRRLQATDIRVSLIATKDPLEAELFGIVSNFARRQPSILEAGEMLVRTFEIFRSLGRRAGRGRPRKSATVADLTTPYIAHRVGISVRYAQRALRIAQRLPLAVRDLLRGTERAGQTTLLEELLRRRDVDEMVRLTTVLVDDPALKWERAPTMAVFRFRSCAACPARVDTFLLSEDFGHCSACGLHFAEIACPTCGAARSATPLDESRVRSIGSGYAAWLNSGSTPVLNSPQQPFTERGVLSSETKPRAVRERTAREKRSKPFQLVASVGTLDREFEDWLRVLRSTVDILEGIAPDRLAQSGNGQQRREAREIVTRYQVWVTRFEHADASTL